MSASVKADLQILDPITALATANESAAQTLPTRVDYIVVSSDVAVFFRLKTGENGFRIPANFPVRIDVSGLSGGTFFIRNDSGSNANVSFLVKTTNAQG